MHNELKRSAWVEINLGALVKNYNELKELSPGSEVISCIKADAYGHGAVKVAWELVKSGTDYLGVATLAEAVDIREAGIRKPIVLLSATPKGNVKDIIDLDIIPVITSYKDAKILSELMAKFAPEKIKQFFLALETGMGRLGILNDSEGLEEIAKINELPLLKMKGVFSHFATADEEDTSYAIKQLDVFNEFVDKLNSVGITTNSRTMANSAAIIMFPQSHFEIVRPGLALYGLYPCENAMTMIDLTPVMSVKAEIIFIKKVPANFCVSYGKRFVTERESLLATISVGYADGLPRITSGKARVIINGTYAPIVGNICMDQCMIDVTDVPDVKESDEVVLMGTQDGLTISAEEIAFNSETINYEVVTRFGQRLPKIFK